MPWIGSPRGRRRRGDDTLSRAVLVGSVWGREVLVRDNRSRGRRQRSEDPAGGGVGEGAVGVLPDQLDRAWGRRFPLLHAEQGVCRCVSGRGPVEERPIVW